MEKELDMLLSQLDCEKFLSDTPNKTPPTPSPTHSSQSPLTNISPHLAFISGKRQWAPGSQEECSFKKTQ